MPPSEYYLIGKQGAFYNTDELLPANESELFLFQQSLWSRQHSSVPAGDQLLRVPEFLPVVVPENTEPRQRSCVELNNMQKYVELLNSDMRNICQEMGDMALAMRAAFLYGQTKITDFQGAVEKVYIDVQKVGSERDSMKAKIDRVWEELSRTEVHPALGPYFSQREAPPDMSTLLSFSFSRSSSSSSSSSSSAAAAAAVSTGGVGGIVAGDRDMGGGKRTLVQMVGRRGVDRLLESLSLSGDGNGNGNDASKPAVLGVLRERLEKIRAMLVHYDHDYTSMDGKGVRLREKTDGLMRQSQEAIIKFGEKMEEEEEKKSKTASAHDVFVETLMYEKLQERGSEMVREVQQWRCDIGEQKDAMVELLRQVCLMAQINGEQCGDVAFIAELKLLSAESKARKKDFRRLQEVLDLPAAYATFLKEVSQRRAINAAITAIGDALKQAMTLENKRRSQVLQAGPLRIGRDLFASVLRAAPLKCTLELMLDQNLPAIESGEQERLSQQWIVYFLGILGVEGADSAVIEELRGQLAVANQEMTAQNRSHRDHCSHLEKFFKSELQQRETEIVSLQTQVEAAKEDARQVRAAVEQTLADKKKEYETRVLELENNVHHERNLSRERLDQAIAAAEDNIAKLTVKHQVAVAERDVSHESIAAISRSMIAFADFVRGLSKREDTDLTMELPTEGVVSPNNVNALLERVMSHMKATEDRLESVENLMSSQVMEQARSHEEMYAELQSKLVTVESRNSQLEQELKYRQEQYEQSRTKIMEEMQSLREELRALEGKRAAAVDDLEQLNESSSAEIARLQKTIKESEVDRHLQHTQLQKEITQLREELERRLLQDATEDSAVQLENAEMLVKSLLDEKAAFVRRLRMHFSPLLEEIEDNCHFPDSVVELSSEESLEEIMQKILVGLTRTRTPIWLEGLQEDASNQVRRVMFFRVKDGLYEAVSRDPHRCFLDLDVLNNFSESSGFRKAKAITGRVVSVTHHEGTLVNSYGVSRGEPYCCLIVDDVQAVTQKTFM